MKTPSLVCVLLLCTVWSVTIVPQADEPYRRDAWPHWSASTDGTCLDVRQRVLADESLIAPLIRDCRVVRGRWRDPYTGRRYDSPVVLDIDHRIPLAEAHRSGGAAWSVDQKRAYANDLTHPNHLVAVHRSVNRQKGDQDPSTWVPSVDVCGYVIAWIGIKGRYQLTYDDAEAHAILRHLGDCF